MSLKPVTQVIMNLRKNSKSKAKTKFITNFTIVKMVDYDWYTVKITRGRSGIRVCVLTFGYNGMPLSRHS